MKNNRGFTLVELIIVIAILAIIMLIAIPNFSVIQQRMQVRADRATASQIGKAARIYYTEYQLDPVFKKAVDDSGNGIPKSESPMKKISTVESLDLYVDTGLEPTSLRTETNTKAPGQCYWVGMSETGTGEKIVVAIALEAPTTEADMSANTHALYDGAYLDSPTLSTSTAYVES